MFTMLNDFFAALRRLTVAANDAANDVETFRQRLRAGLGHTADAPRALEPKADDAEPAVVEADRKERASRNGKPVRVYLGRGAAAELAAAADELRRLKRAVEDRERRAGQARLEEAEAPLLELCEATDLLTRAALATAGYHRHDRGAWRRRREPETTD